MCSPVVMYCALRSGTQCITEIYRQEFRRAANPDPMNTTAWDDDVPAQQSETQRVNTTHIFSALVHIVATLTLYLIDTSWCREDLNPVNQRHYHRFYMIRTCTLVITIVAVIVNITTAIQTWNLSKILHDWIFGPKILHTKKHGNRKYFCQR